MKSLKFRPKLIRKILDGTKTRTWRLFDDKDLTVGDELSLINVQTDQVFALARICEIHERTLDDMWTADPDGHELYESKEEMLATFRGYYGDRVTLQTPVKVIEFCDVRPQNLNA